MRSGGDSLSGQSRGRGVRPTPSGAGPRSSPSVLSGSKAAPGGSRTAAGCRHARGAPNCHQMKQILSSSTPLSVPRPSQPARASHGPARAGHAAPLHRVHPWGVGDPSLASQPMQRAHSGDAGGLRRDIAAAAHTQKSSGSPGPPCFFAWFIGLRPRPRRGTLSWPILIARAPGNSPSDQTGAVNS